MRAVENEVLHPLGLQALVNLDPNLPPDEWAVEEVWYNWQHFTSVEQFTTAYRSG